LIRLNRISKTFNGVVERQHRFALLLFAVYVVAGIILAFDYGVPIDEQTQRGIGIANNQFISRGELGILDHKFYGPIFETTAFWLEQVFFPAGNSRGEFFLRHIYLFLIVASSALPFYRTIFLLTKYAPTALLATAVYVLHPRIFADSFYNSKDVLFMALLTWAVWFFTAWLQTGQRKTLIAFCISAGIMASLRIQGLYIPFLGFLSWMILYRPPRRTILTTLVIAVLITLLSLIAVYPYLWLNPWQHLAEVLGTARSFPWPWGTLTAGNYYVSKQTPIWYLPVWIAVTTPTVFLLLVLAGLALVFRRPYQKMSMVLTLLWVLPFILAIAMYAPMYDGWRHYFFLWPLMVSTGSLAIHRITQIIANKRWIYWLLVLPALVDIVRAHPHSMVYFNEAYRNIDKPMHERWEMDYWGLGYRHSLETLAGKYPDTLRVYSWEQGLELNRRILSTELRNRIQITTRDSAQYLFENIRGPKRQAYPGEIVYALTPYGDTTLVVFRQY
jgi:hypothetical protein